jgi:hypothetical protein
VCCWCGEKVRTHGDHIPTSYQTSVRFTGDSDHEH